MPAILKAVAILPAAPPNTPFQGSLAGAHFPVMLDMSPSWAHTPLERGIWRHSLRSGNRISSMARSYTFCVRSGAFYSSARLIPIPIKS